MKWKVLVTGGAGYIGSHTVVELIHAGHEVVIIDNLCNSSLEAIRRVEDITHTSIPFYEADVRDQEVLDEIFETHTIGAVLHFAGLKAVGESVEKPLLYYDNNVRGSIVLLESMAKHSVKKLVFSSSATVYGSAPYPYTENETAGVGIVNPYGRTKYITETILQDIAALDGSLSIVALRYFNPVGAHESGLIGENPLDTPNNLMPYIAQVAVGKIDKLRIFGGDYETLDGTGVRDYIHVVDLAKGHVKALEKLQNGFNVFNLGTGVGTSVLQILHAFEKASSKKIAFEIVERRAGDLPEFYADTNKAKAILGWNAEKNIDEMCADTWRWQSRNPEGYATSNRTHSTHAEALPALA